jgi:3-hydroxyacyl-CoA dehydrogenase / enoyl-CoA hydratase / 3-hydroxybutyryl-CoA epimerase
VRAPETGDPAVAAAIALARRIGKTAVVVADQPGLVAWRLVVPYIAEALRLAAEGVPADRIDAAARRYGLGITPMRLHAELGPAEFAAVASRLAERLGTRFAPPPAPALPAMAPPLGARMLARVAGAARFRRGGASTPASREAVRDRIVLAVVNEAARLLDDAVVPHPRDVDRVLVLALGISPELGGLLWDADRAGPAALVARLEELAARHGERFEPAPRLLRMAAAGLGFYAIDPVSSAAAER